MGICAALISHPWIEAPQIILYFNNMATMHRIYTMSLAGVHPHYISKAEKKGRFLDKLIDELARGKKMEMILRQA